MTSATKSPDEVVRTILDADAIGCAHDIAELAHPDYCADLKRRQVFSFRAQSGSVPDIGTADLGAMTISEAKRRLKGTLRAVFDVASIEELETVDSVSFVERVIAACYWGLPSRTGRGELLGTVKRSEDEAHAVIEQRWAAPGAVAGLSAKYPRVAVMTLRRAGDRWLSLLNGGLAIEAHHPIAFGA